MDISNFEIGLHFFCCNSEYVCTDVGTRTITAICISNMKDQSWKNGPPYAVEEISFDENDIPACTISMDGNVTIEVDISDDDFLQIAKSAHEENITINDLIVKRLEQYIKKSELEDKKTQNVLLKKPLYSNFPWNKEEELQLLDEFAKGLDIEQIAKNHQRTTGAINSRLPKLGIYHTFQELMLFKPKVKKMYNYYIHNHDSVDITPKNLGKSFKLTESEVKIIIDRF